MASAAHPDEFLGHGRAAVGILAELDHGQTRVNHVGLCSSTLVMDPDPGEEQNDYG
jgi:hypothetical protein